MSRQDSPAARVMLVGYPKARKDLFNTWAQHFLGQDLGSDIASSGIDMLNGFHEGQKFTIWDVNMAATAPPPSDNALVLIVLNANNVAEAEATLDRFTKDERWVHYPNKLCVYTLASPSAFLGRAEEIEEMIKRSELNCPRLQQALFQDEAACLNRARWSIELLPADAADHGEARIRALATEYLTQSRLEVASTTKTILDQMKRMVAAPAIVASAAAGAGGAAAVTGGAAAAVTRKYDIVLVGGHDSVKATLDQFDRDLGIRRTPEQTVPLVRAYIYEGVTFVCSSISVTPLAEADVIMPVINASMPLDDIRALSIHQKQLRTYPESMKTGVLLTTMESMIARHDELPHAVEILDGLVGECSLVKTIVTNPAPGADQSRTIFNSIVGDPRFLSDEAADSGSGLHR